MRTTSERLSLVISKELKKKIDDFKERLHLDQSSLIRLLLEDALSEKLLEYAINEYREGRVSLGQAVQLAETDYWTFLDVLSRRNIPYISDEEDHHDEILRVGSGEYKKFV
ncbi:MAG: UPF0175 family protein [Promethearchaeota archaeon]